MALKDRGEILDCKCEGRNPDCQTCSGKGYYYQIPDSKKPQKKISNPSDPFPLIAYDSEKAESENSQLKRHLDKYARGLANKRKNKEEREEKQRQKKARAREEELRKEIKKLKEEKKKNRGMLENIQKKKRKRIDKK